MRGNTITVPLTEGVETIAPSLYQYDYGQRAVLTGVDLPDAYEVHFANSRKGTSTTSIGDATGVDIPDIYLTTGSDVFLWLYLHAGEDDGETEFRSKIPVIQRAKVTNDTPTPVQQDAITQAIAALNTAVDNAERAQGAAEIAQQEADNARSLAVEAKDAAVAAQGLAEAAQSGAASAQGLAEAAKDDAVRAKQQAQAAESVSGDNALISEGFAVGEQNGEPVPSSSPYHNNNAAFYANAAEQAANSLGYMDMYIDHSTGHLFYQRVTESDVDFELDENGHLIMTHTEGE